MQRASTSQNLRTVIRIRPIDYQQKMLEVLPDNYVSIKDPSNKQSEKQSFQYSQIIDQQSSQEQAFKNVCEPLIQKMIEGHNGCILAYGQTGAGKTYSIFGEDEKYSVNSTNFSEGKKDKRGLVPRCLELLFRKEQEYEDMREFVITVSIAEIYLDQIRDLGKKFDDLKSAVQQYENENLNIYENSNGQIMIKDLTNIQITGLNQLYDLLKNAFQLRDQAEAKGTQIWARAHSIFTINLVQKDKENDNLPFMNATLQIVDLAGSERIAKSLTEGHKFQEAILINSSLTALGKCLNCINQQSNKNIPYRESKLTRVLQNCLNTQSNIALMGMINPNESNYEECLSTLQYLDRIKTNSNKANNQPDELMMNVGSYPGQEKVIKKLNDEITELKGKIEFLQKEQKQKMQDIQNIFGFDTDLDKILQKSSKELQQFRLQKEAVTKLENVNKQNNELEHKIDKLQKIIDEMKKEDSIKQERFSCQIIEYKEQIKKLKDQINIIKMNSEDEIRKLNNERESEIKRMIDKSNALVEEKTNLIINLPQNISNKTADNQKLQEVKKMTKYELEKEFKTQIESIKNEYTKLLQGSKQQYEFLLQEKNKELEQFLSEFKKYREKKKSTINELKYELSEVYDVVLKQSKVIEKIENGGYSAGIRSFNIPTKDKPQLPSRNKFRNLFMLLDAKNAQISKQVTSSEQNKTIEFKKVAAMAPYDSNKDQMEIKTIETVDLNINISKLSHDNLKVFAENLKNSLSKSLTREKELKEKLSNLEQINQNIDIGMLIKEKEEFRNLYLTELKKNNQNRVVLESQRRLINTSKVFKETRPSTQGKPYY